MAKFGLESSSDSEASTSSRSVSPPPFKSKKSTKTRVSASSHDDSELESDAAPPRASLMRSDDSDDQESDESAVESSRRSPSFALEHSASPAPRQATPRRAPPARATPSAAKSNNTVPWPKTLGLESKRVQLMQASFFQQSNSTSSEGDRKLSSNIIPTTKSIPPKPTPAFPSPPPLQSHFNAAIVDPGPPAPSRRYTRVPLAQSLTANKEGSFVDSELANGRSYRIGWGPQGEIIHIGALYGAEVPERSDAITIDRLQQVASPTDSESATILRTLQLQLAHTPIYSESEFSTPYPVPHPEFRFHHFTKSLSPTDRSPEAQLWRLGHALFDEIDDIHVEGRDLASGVLNRLTEIRRRKRLEKWLEDVVRGDVEEQLRDIAAGGAVDAGARRIFALLSGHQIERACEAAMDSRDFRLATLLSQAGGDDSFRADIILQLAKWREYRVDPHISKGYRRIYEILSGNVGISAGVSEGDAVDQVPAIYMSEGLDWKRAFGLQLWYGKFQATVSTSLAEYAESTTADLKIASPLPLYLEKPSTASAASPKWKPTPTPPSDPLFEMIKLYTDPSHSLESVLLPRNFTSSPLDYRLPWHLYILFSRVLRKRDFGDRIELGDEAMDGPEGNSVRADMMTEGYASQLEGLGMFTWAIFVLLHLELPSKRAQAIKAVIGRSVSPMSPEDHEFLVDTLKIPATWIYSAQATTAKYNGEVFLEFELRLVAKDQNGAHEIVVSELAPEAVLRGDFGVLRRLLEPLLPDIVVNWDVGGQVYLDYADAMQGIGDREVDVELIEGLAKTYPGLKMSACVQEMKENLIKLSPTLTKARNLVQSHRLLLLQSKNANFLTSSLAMAMES